MSTVPTALRRAAATLGLPPDHPAITYLGSLSSRSSRNSMLGAVRRVAVFFGCPVAAVPWTEITHARMVLLRTWLGEHYGPSTANHALCAVRGVLRAAARAGLISREQVASASDVPPVRGSRVAPGRALAREELGKMFRSCAGRGGPIAARDVALLAVVYGCGLRRNELSRLDLEDIQSDALLVKGKGNRERLVPVPPDALTALRRWLEVRGSEPGPLFLRAHRRSRQIDPIRLSGTGLYHVLARIAREAGVPPFTPHDCRRTYIGDLLDLHVDLVTVASLVGHSSVSTTQRYDRRPERARRAAVARLAIPLDVVAESERPTG